MDDAERPPNDDETDRYCWNIFDDTNVLLLLLTETSDEIVMEELWAYGRAPSNNRGGCDDRESRRLPTKIVFDAVVLGETVAHAIIEQASVEVGNLVANLIAFVADEWPVWPFFYLSGKRSNIPISVRKQWTTIRRGRRAYDDAEGVEE